jgi:hypothetical protein
VCVCIVQQSWADVGAEAELHGRAAALAVSNVGDDPAAAPLELEIRDRRQAQGAAVAPVEHARTDAVEPRAARRRRHPRPVGAGDGAQVGDGRRRDVCRGEAWDSRTASPTLRGGSVAATPPPVRRCAWRATGPRGWGPAAPTRPGPPVTTPGGGESGGPTPGPPTLLDPAQPSPAQPSPAQPSPAQPSPAQPSAAGERRREKRQRQQQGRPAPARGRRVTRALPPPMRVRSARCARRAGPLFLTTEPVLH